MAAYLQDLMNRRIAVSLCATVMQRLIPDLILRFVLLWRVACVATETISVITNDGRNIIVSAALPEATANGSNGVALCMAVGRSQGLRPVH